MSVQVDYPAQHVVIFHWCINPFPLYKILDQPKLKAFADNKLNVTKMIIPVFYRLENVVEKGEIACTSNFSFSHNVFKRLFPRCVKRCHCVGTGYLFTNWQNFRLVQIEGMSRQPNKSDLKNENYFGKGRKHCEKRRKWWWKGENGGYHHFLLFPQCFQKASLFGSFKVRIVW